MSVTGVSPNCSRRRSLPRCRYTVSNSNPATLEWLDFSSACHALVVAMRQAGHLDDQQYLASTVSWWLCGGVVGLAGYMQAEQKLVRFLTYPPHHQEPSSRVRKLRTHAC